MKLTFKTIVLICCIMQMQHLHPMVAAEEELVTSTPESKNTEAYNTFSAIDDNSNLDTDNEDLLEEPVAFTIQIEQEPVQEQLTKPDDKEEEATIKNKKVTEMPEESSDEEQPLENQEKEEEARKEIIEQEEIMSE